MEYKGKCVDCRVGPSFPGALNRFYAWFKASNPSLSTMFTALPGELPFSVSVGMSGGCRRGLPC